MISPPSSQRLSTCRRMVVGERLEAARCSMKGRKQTTSASPGGRSFSSPIQERGQFSDRIVHVPANGRRGKTRGGQMLDEGPEANHQCFSWGQVFFQPHPGTRPVFQIVAVGGRRCRDRKSVVKG